MIKSDRWIRQQCVPAPFMVKEMVPVPQTPGFDVYYLPKVMWRLTHMTEEQILAAIAHNKFSEIGIKDFRPATPEDLANFRPMIAPYIPGQVRAVESELAAPKKIVSYGTSSFGYDVRLADKFKIFTNINNGIIDPLAVNDKCYVDFEGDKCIIPPNSYVLGHTIETFDIPRDVMVICLGKSTYARCGAIVNVTPIEAGFRGQVVIEISNATNLPLVVHANQGIAQFLFFQSDEACEVSYADRGGKYQDQRGIQTALV